MNSLQRRMVGHGAVLMLIALAAGFGLAMSLVGGFEFIPGSIAEFELPGDSRAWARTHAGGLLNGLMVLVVALLLHAMSLPERAEGQIGWMIVGAGYANTIFYWAGMLAANRALTFGTNRFGESDIMALIGFTPAFVFAFITMYAFAIIARHAFAPATDEGAD